MGAILLVSASCGLHRVPASTPGSAPWRIVGRDGTVMWQQVVPIEFVVDLVGHSALQDCLSKLDEGWSGCTVQPTSCVTIAVEDAMKAHIMVFVEACRDSEPPRLNAHIDGWNWLIWRDTDDRVMFMPIAGPPISERPAP